MKESNNVFADVSREILSVTLDVLPCVHAEGSKTSHRCAELGVSGADPQTAKLTHHANRYEVR